MATRSDRRRRYLLRDLERTPLADRTREAYGQHVGAYGVGLGTRGEGVLALSEARARDYSARDFKRQLGGPRLAPALGNWRWLRSIISNRFLGLGPAEVKREPLARAAAKALSEDQQRAAEASRPRDRAIVILVLYTTGNLHEVAALDVNHVSVSARKALPPAPVHLASSPGVEKAELGS